MPVLMAGRDHPARRALALGGAGDVALLGRGEIAFTAGLVSFLGGHVAWIIASRQRPGGGTCAPGPGRAARGDVRRDERLPVEAHGQGPHPGLRLQRRPARDVPDGAGYRLAADGGGALFLASDTLLALEKFGDLRLPAHEGLVMATYASAQALLAG